jgi:hypothetical protein
MASLGPKSKRGGTSLNPSKSLFNELPTKIRLHIYSYLSELDLSNLIRVSKRIHEEGVGSLYANTKFTLEIVDKSVRFYNTATVQDCQESRQMRLCDKVEDLPPHFDRVRQLRFICNLDMKEADKQGDYAAQAATRLSANNSPSRNIDISFLYVSAQVNHNNITLAAQNISKPLQRLRTIGVVVNTATVVEHITRQEDLRVWLQEEHEPTK